MEQKTKADILGDAATGAVRGKRLQADIAARGHPFTFSEVKPLNLWQRICEHNGVTHIVDFTPGSAALAIAAAGAMEYEGIAATDVHRDWLDSTLDRVVLYMAGQDKNFAEKLGGDAEFIEKVGKYFSGTMMEARRLLEPVSDETCAQRESDDDMSLSESEE